MASIIKHKNTWYARWSVNGKRVEKTTGVKVEGDAPASRLKKLAQVTADAMEASAVGNSSVAGALAAVSAMAEALGLEGRRCPTLSEFFNDYQPHGALQNVSNAKRAIARFLEFHSDLLARRLDAITVSHCRDWLRAESARVSGGTVKGYRAHLSAAFTRAYRDDLIAKNPFSSLRVSEYAKKGDSPQKREPFTREEISRMVRELPAPWCDMVLVSFFTGGQRLGDIACLRWESVDFERGMVMFKTQKTATAIESPMIASLRECLLALRARVEANEPYVFPEMETRYRRSKGVLSVEFTALLRGMGILTAGAPAASGRDARRSVSAKSFHSIRHSVVSFLRENASISQDVSRAIVGHDSEEIERAYFTASAQAKLAGIELLQSAIEEKEGKL